MQFKANILGHQIQINPSNLQRPGYVSPVNEKRILEAIDVMKKYKAGKENLEARIIEEEEWYKSQHWDIIRKKKASDADPEPVTAYLFNTLANKHADAMDNYPEANIFERQKDDVEEAQRLSKIIPLVIEKNNYRDTYSDGWWYKLKHGFVIYGSFWNPELENGIGDVDIQYLDALNVIWQPGIKNIQRSRNLFIPTLVDNDILEAEHPELKGKLTGEATIDIKKYIFDDSVDTTDKSVVIDWYYKKKLHNGKTIVHLTKFVGKHKIESTEDDPDYAQTGLYDDGEYPVEIDVLFPEEGTPIGFGFIAICKNPQMYIDKLDQIISKNALVAGKIRWLIKDNGNINEKELLDFSKDVVHGTGDIGEESARQIQANPLHPFIVQHRQEKINELKEISGANDFTRGESGGGVTAYSAIAALQEAGNKLSRDMIARSYSTYTKIVYKVISRIRQFYDETRVFRITNEDGTSDYIDYNNKGLKEQQLPKAYEGEGMMIDPKNPMAMIPDPKYVPKFRLPIFDIEVKPERANPFNKLAMNGMAQELFSIGFFDPARAMQAKVALEMMNFEGKDKVLKMINENDQIMQQLQQMAMTIQKMNMVIANYGGIDVLKAASGQAPTQQGSAPAAQPNQQPQGQMHTTPMNTAGMPARMPQPAQMMKG